ncbi:error-prone DNA polymerase [Nocardioides dokdonensis FR1436]|uniref:Error-prone DNA polymerase n=1 Tax=Nocardioides dokdonensis FR1436 TaxID=1300347 RepID=A0A1A9GE62_9ACTN|nr:PHP domain-containing protein [Nocardioides dokdonensis]ANH36538.1 error-prone DNA polymerase [Nocardioides dokdonensis FR1436]
MRIDLHTHSRASDGTQSPAELVHAAVAADLDVLALTDHDTAAGWDEAAGAASAAGLRLVRGMEISTRFDGQGVHLLAYLPDPSYPPLAAELERILEGRRSRVPGILEGLRGAGISLTEADVARVSGHSAASGRPHVADALVALGVVADRTEAFDRLLSPGRPGYVDRYAAPLRDMIGLVAAAGGVSVVAHVWGRRHDESPDGRALAELAGLGLAGIEVDHQDHSPAARERLRGIARELDLVVTGSSDHHGDGKVDHDLGCHTTAPEQLERLLDLAAAAALASGRDAPGPV